MIIGKYFFWKRKKKANHKSITNHKLFQFGIIVLILTSMFTTYKLQLLLQTKLQFTTKFWRYSAPRFINKVPTLEFKYFELWALMKQVNFNHSSYLIFNGFINQHLLDTISRSIKPCEHFQLYKWVTGENELKNSEVLSRLFVLLNDGQ